MESLKVISLFSGAGGMDIGFIQAGFDIRVAVENDPACCDTLRHNKKKFAPNMTILEGDITQISSQEILEAADLKPLEAALVIGGPPCQSFSLAGDRKGLDDPRGKLIQEFFRVVKEILPVGFVMENVKGMLNWSNGKALDTIEKEATSAIEYCNCFYQYNISHKLLNAADFGVPQLRERVFFVGNRIGIDFTFPAASHYRGETATPLLGLKPCSTVDQAISKLGPPTPPSETAQRVARTIKGRIAKHGY